MKKKVPIKEFSDNATINLVLDTINIKKQALVFVNSKRSAEKTAEDIAKKIKISDKESEIISQQALNSLAKPTKQCERLSLCLRKGIAFHHSGLTAKQKDLIQEKFREGKIKIISCTPTLAAGIDMPSFRTILKDLKRFSHHGMSWIPVLEYEQMAGRSGRPSFGDKFGEAIAVASTKSEKNDIYDKYVCGAPEEIYSKLAVEPVLRTYLLSLIATGFAANKKQILDFFEKTFWAYQYEDMDKLENIISKMLNLLEEFEFIRISGNTKDFVCATEIADGKITATKLGKRVAELYIDPLTANQIIICLRTASNKDAKEFSFLHMVSSRLEMRPLLRTRVKEYEEMQEKLAFYDDFLIEQEPSIYEPEYEDFINSIKTALFFQDWIDEKDEEYLLERYNIRPGEIVVKLNNADWLLYASEELARLMQFQKLLKIITKTRFRLKYGVKEELFALLKLKKIGRVRARKLYNQKIKDISDVKKADVMTLVQILGKSTAIDVKKQVGQDIEKEKIPERKKKGQISLLDY